MAFKDLTSIEKGLLIKKLAQGGYLKDIKAGDLISTVERLYDEEGSTNTDYKTQLINWAVKNEGALWQNTPEASKARQWLRTNYPEDLDSLYWSMSDTNRAKVDPRLLSHKVNQQLVENKTREGINKAGTFIYNTAKSISDFTPIGDITQITEATNSAITGNYKAAILGLAGAVLPNVIENPLKKARFLLTHGVDDYIVRKNIKNNTPYAIVPSLAAIDKDSSFFNYAGKNGVTFIGDNSLLENSLLFNGDGLTETVSTVFPAGTGKLSYDDISESIIQAQRKIPYKKVTINDWHNQNIIPDGYNEAKYMGLLPYDKFKYAVVPNSQSDIIEYLNDLNVKVLPFDGTKINERDAIIKNIFNTYPELLFSDGGDLLFDFPTEPEKKSQPIIISDSAERIARQAWTESVGNDKAVSKRGAVGRYQIMPNNLKEYQTTTGLKGDLNDPVYNKAVRDWVMDGIMKSQTITRGNPSDAVKLAKIYAAYNWGLGNLGNYLQKQKDSGVDIYNGLDWIEGMPVEPRDYVNFIVLGKDSGAHRTSDAFYGKYPQYNKASIKTKK